MPALAHVAGMPLEEMAAYAAPAVALGLSAFAAGLRGVIAARLPTGRRAGSGPVAVDASAAREERC